jgi:O-succinylbenzoic acid--CoA ligase
MNISPSGDQPMTWIQWSQGRCAMQDVLTSTPLSGANDFERASFHFIRQWLAGQDSFPLQTSGSTGVPKKIMAARAQLKASAQLTIEALGLQAGQTALVSLDTRYIAGIMMLVRALECGMNILLEKPAANPLLSIDPKISIDFTALVPYQVAAIIRSPMRERFTRIRNVLIGGAAPDRSLEKEIQSFQNNVYATYGMTETLSHIALRKLSGGIAQKYYQALPGISLSVDERGCLLVRAPHLEEKVFVTNDLVELLSPGTFRWLGRIDHVINTGGVKIIPETVERKIALLFEQLSIQKRFFIAGLADPQFGQCVALIVEGKPLAAEVEALIKKEMAIHLNRYEQPRVIHCLEKFVETETGKVNKIKTLQTAGIK